MKEEEETAREEERGQLFKQEHGVCKGTGTKKKSSVIERE